jgi:hypothetical protein
MYRLGSAVPPDAGTLVVLALVSETDARRDDDLVFALITFYKRTVKHKDTKA